MYSTHADCESNFSLEMIISKLARTQPRKGFWIRSIHTERSKGSLQQVKSSLYMT